MNPKPLASLNHFTVPCSMMDYFLLFLMLRLEINSGVLPGRNQLSETRCCVFPFQTATYPYIIARFLRRGAPPLFGGVKKKKYFRTPHPPPPRGGFFKKKIFYGGFLFLCIYVGGLCFFLCEFSL